MPGNSWSIKKSTIEYYDRLADIYDSLYGGEQKAKIKIIFKVMNAEAGGLVLDIGCGTGLLMEYLVADSGCLVGVDLSVKSLRRARERLRRLEAEQDVSLIRADAENLPFRNEVFDKIFALTLLQNTPSPRRALREIIRVAKDKSQAIVTGLRKYFTIDEFRGLISSFGEYELFPESHDFIAVLKVDKQRINIGSEKNRMGE
ncbi:class I SAM-dependent methyltransferase [Candidatus Bathyarchaeota archaeon]|nr:class I SAM-dependent methyltransferase [Candidatus Bathyarchaeota archaeon]